MARHLHHFAEKRTTTTICVQALHFLISGLYLAKIDPSPKNCLWDLWRFSFGSPASEVQNRDFCCVKSQEMNFYAVLLDDCILLAGSFWKSLYLL
uniref:Uncharacterized protein n=1 Tax=Manihot esculenta TaxID=3983 RepID=A0A2C9TZ63_MANES